MATVSSYFNNCDMIARPHARLPDVFTLKSKKKKSFVRFLWMNSTFVCEKGKMLAVPLTMPTTGNCLFLWWYFFLFLKLFLFWKTKNYSTVQKCWATKKKGREKTTAATCERKITYFIMTIHFSGSIQSTSLFLFSDALNVALFPPKDKEDQTEMIFVCLLCGRRRRWEMRRSDNDSVAALASPC